MLPCWVTWVAVSHSKHTHTLTRTQKKLKYSHVNTHSLSFQSADTLQGADSGMKAVTVALLMRSLTCCEWCLQCVFVRLYSVCVLLSDVNFHLLKIHSFFFFIPWSRILNKQPYTLLYRHLDPYQNRRFQYVFCVCVTSAKEGAAIMVDLSFHRHSCAQKIKNKRVNSELKHPNTILILLESKFFYEKFQVYISFYLTDCLPLNGM